MIFNGCHRLLQPQMARALYNLNLSRLVLFALVSANALADYTLQSTWLKHRTQYPFATPFMPDGHGVVKSTSLYRGDLALDQYRPPGAELLPAILLIHGGGWNSGARTLWEPMAQALARRGYSAITVSYRLSGVATYPAALDDLHDALNYVKSHATELNVDTRFIAIGGGSAGGQLAALAGLTWPVQAIVNVDGLSDFTTPLALQFENDVQRTVTAASAWLGGRYEEVPDRWQAASPITHLHSKAPPMLFITSGRARFSAGIEPMQEQLDKLGIVNQRFALPDSPHSFWLLEPWASQTLDAIDQFLQGQAGFKPSLPCTPSSTTVP